MTGVLLSLQKSGRGESRGSGVGLDEKRDALSLAGRLPLVTSGWVWYRKPRTLTRLYKQQWAELRGGTLLVYQDVEEGRFRRLQGEQIVAKTPPERVVVLVLKEEALRINEKKRRLRSKSRNGEIYDIKFRNDEECRVWMEEIEQATNTRTVGLNDFETLSTLGHGASGKVFLVKDRETEESLALKVIEKTSIFETNDAYRHAVDERLVLELTTNFPFILDLRYAFQTSKRLYLVTEYCSGGDLFDFLKCRGRLIPEKQAVRLMAEVLLALEYIHSLGVVYRDMKLENILLDGEGHVRVADFGLSKCLQLDSVDQGAVNLTTTFCGTREYVAPEMLAGKAYGHSVDLWAYGILLYEILCGRTPFYSSQRDEIYNRIETAPLEFPAHLTEHARSLISGLLERNPQKRFGAKGLHQVMAHPFFRNVNWLDLLNKVPHEDNIKIDSPSLSLDFSCTDINDSDGRWLQSDREEMDQIGMKREIFSRFLVSRKKTSGSIAGYSFTSSMSRQSSTGCFSESERQESRLNLSRGREYGGMERQDSRILVAKERGFDLPIIPEPLCTKLQHTATL